MELNINGVQVSVSENAVAELVRQRLLGIVEVSRPLSTNWLSRAHIGEYWPGQGGIFTGLVCLRSSIRPRAVITAEQFDDDTWETMKTKAAAVTVDGHQDFRLPYRNEQLLQWENIPDLFKKQAYWSIEPYADDSSSAWYQSFTYGYQGYFHKDYKLRGCAVRSFEI